jgi:phage shock protein E
MRLSRWMILGLLLLTVVLAGCGSKGEELPALIGPQDAQSRIDSGDSVVLLDVRTPEEFTQDGRSPDAILIPLDELEARVDELDKDDTIVVICRSGNRSQAAADILRDSGFDHVTEVEGGMRNWIAQGLEYECDTVTCGLAQ